MYFNDSIQVVCYCGMLMVVSQKLTNTSTQQTITSNQELFLLVEL